MLIFRSVAQLEEFVQLNIENHKSIGLVPTMGALHDGHISLVKTCVAQNDVSVVSVFVNPTQFNNPEDLASYPRNEEADLRLLAQNGVDAVFAPTPEDVYPEGLEAAASHVFNLGSAAEVMEGKFRPGHFQGVAQIVSRLFRICRPTRAYFGEKDFQQIAVIRNMVESEHIKVEIVACPICRDADGLALSSRNALLSAEQRKNAPEIYHALSESVEYSHYHSVDATRRSVVERLDAVPEMKVEYFQIVDGRTLLPVEEWDESPYIVGCITVYNGKVRLIDNICYRGR
ncbi:MAG: pantoate--beta-alanine ligase [Clostridium sp.]|nr:pantoate--beta-alanine ligase [Prevotella sp.]MCM1429630.1 pantoate--beta-alanine ligase [Clostridium sp.]MCM1474686.1 pantoate--beta-alanine ligase [Muribaculaceae bacterium]